MRIAIFHNFMDNIGGAEIVDLMLAKALGADIYTTNINKEKIEKMGFSTKNIYSIGKVPINAPFRQEATYWRFRTLNLGKKYDFYIIAGDWAMSAATNNKPNLWYVYSPVRELYDLHKYVKNEMVPWHGRPIFILWTAFHRFLNRIDIKHVQKIASISKNVQSRVRKFLNRNSKIIYSPTETSLYKYKPHKNYWLSVNRLSPHKRVDLQLKAFSKLPNEKLIIVGSYEKSQHFLKEIKRLQKIKPKNVEILSWISQPELVKLYSECKGVLATAKDEDYGLSPVEAMASGKPIIAANEGGYKETITSKTGILIDNINPEKLVDAIKSMKNPKKYKDACLKQAKKFDIKNFISQIKNEIKR